MGRIGIVDHTGAVVLESFVFVHPANVRDWRSSSSGIKPGDLDGGEWRVEAVALGQRFSTHVRDDPETSERAC